MVCKRFQSEGMKLLDEEMTKEERAAYEAHFQQCEDCKRELKEIGMVVEWTNELKLKKPDDEFWESYWDGIYRKLERGAGFLFVIIGVAALILFGIVRAVLSPHFFTFQGIAVTIVLLGFLILFISVAKERYYERRNDPYRKVQR
jgi:hypothetical protein